MSPIAEITTITNSNNRIPKRREKTNAALTKMKPIKPSCYLYSIPDENNSSLSLKKTQVQKLTRSFYTKRDLPQFWLFINTSNDCRVFNYLRKTTHLPPSKIVNPRRRKNFNCNSNEYRWQPQTVNTTKILLCTAGLFTSWC